MPSGIDWQNSCNEQLSYNHLTCISGPGEAAEEEGCQGQRGAGQLRHLLQRLQPHLGQLRLLRAPQDVLPQPAAEVERPPLPVRRAIPGAGAAARGLGLLQRRLRGAAGLDTGAEPHSQGHGRPGRQFNSKEIIWAIFRPFFWWFMGYFWTFFNAVIF